MSQYGVVTRGAGEIRTQSTGHAGGPLGGGGGGSPGWRSALPALYRVAGWRYSWSPASVLSPLGAEDRAHNVRSAPEADRLLEQAVVAGGRIIRPARATERGYARLFGRSGPFPLGGGVESPIPARLGVHYRSASGR